MFAGITFISLFNYQMMETILNTETYQIYNGSQVRHPDNDKSTHGISGFFPAIVTMIAEDGDNFFRYLKDLGLSRENNLVVLSSRHHYFYDENELKHVKTLINLRKLNLIKYLNEFLFTLVQVLPSDTKFLGCFSDYDEQGKGESSFFNPIKHLGHKISNLYSGNERILNKNKVTEMLESYGFKITDMTEMNGLTYFCSQYVQKPKELRA
jgi:hypothetical protein